MESIIARLLKDFEQGKMNRRQLIRSLALAATAASIPSTAPAEAAPLQGQVFKATAFNHVSYQVADYRKSRDFYAGLFGMKISMDDGTQCRLAFGNNILIPRNRTPAPKIDHIAYTIEGWDTDRTVKPALKAELERRKLEIRETTTGGGSFHVVDPDGLEVQMGGKDQ